MTKKGVSKHRCSTCPAGAMCILMGQERFQERMGYCKTCGMTFYLLFISGTTDAYDEVPIKVNCVEEIRVQVLAGCAAEADIRGICHPCWKLTDAGLGREVAAP